MLDLYVKSELEYFIKKNKSKKQKEEMKEETLNYSLNRETSSKTFFQKIIISETPPRPVGLKTFSSSLDHIKIHIEEFPVRYKSLYRPPLNTHNQHLHEDATETSQIIKIIPVRLRPSPQANMNSL